MTNPTGTQWETAILNKLTSNGERLAVMELNFVQLNTKIDKINGDIQEIKTKISSNENRLAEAEEILNVLKTILKLTRLVGMGIIAILLSLAASFIYSLIS